MVKKENVHVRLTRQQLEDYRSLLREATDERIRLRFLEKDAERLGGVTCPQAEAYRNAINENLVRCMEVSSEIQRFINSIEQSTIRRIFTMYYIDGWSWQKIAFAIGSHCESTPRIMHKRYVEKHFEE